MKLRKIVPILILPVLGYIGYYNVFKTGNNHSMNTTASNGINQDSIDWQADPKQNFYEFANGSWMKNTEIPLDKSVYGTIYIIQDRNEEQLKNLVTNLTEQPFNQLDSETQKIVKLYNSFMNEQAIEKLSLEPIKELLTKLDNIQNQAELEQIIAELQIKQITVPFYIHIMQDMKKADQYIPAIIQSGLGLPDRDYYLKDAEPFNTVREKYIQHIQSMLSLANVRQPVITAQKIFELEKTMAKGHWTRVDSRNYDKTYNKKSIPELAKLAPQINWANYLKQLNINEKHLIVYQPSAMTHISQLFADFPIETWKDYLKWHVISSTSPYLSKAFVDENFKFYGQTLSGLAENRPRYKRGIQLINGAMGEALGKHYVKAHFPEKNKQEMEILVGNLMEAFKISLQNNAWMTDKTKQQALVKLANITTKIGYPNKWRDYTNLTISDNLIENIMNANTFEYLREIDKLGKPVDLEEWFMVPQMVNAYYSPNMNEIVFPAAILQPPLFNVNAPDALNYGAIGAIIGHEISHGFDDQGRKFDAKGNLNDWWTKEDSKNFEAHTKKLIEQYAQYEPLKGHFVNGELTLGENIADISGLAIAYQAFKIAEKKGQAQSPTNKKFSNDQLFFLSWAQGWATKIRDQEQLKRLTIDPHSPGRYRAMGTVKNIDAFYNAFNVTENDAMYLPKDQRVNLWSFGDNLMMGQN